MRNKALQNILGYQEILIDSKSRYFKPAEEEYQHSFAAEISHSLTQDQKYIHPRFFYNNKGSQIFEQICKLPEYYITKTEAEILKQKRRELIKFLDGNYRLVELGSGSSVKTRRILDALCENQDKVEYFPIDISNIVEESSRNLREQYDNLHITAIVDKYERGLEFISALGSPKKLVVFLGSSLGNFEPDVSIKFLKKICSSMNGSDFFLIGLDLIKEKEILESAYNDSQGLTADFNLNLLSRINEELSGDFDLSKFEHYAFFNENESRIELYLRSKIEQKVFIAKICLTLEFKKDELIHTEYSYKYSIPQIKKLTKDAGFKIEKIWQDEKKYFALVLLSKN
ncbi:MAG: L-histidine N(alpha)-methyltransferase [Nitrosopumilaceae archaeon]